MPHAARALALPLALTLLLSSACAPHRTSQAHSAPTTAPTESAAVPSAASPAPPSQPPAQPPLQPQSLPGRQSTADTPLEFRELFPGVRVDVAQRVVEFDATVPIAVRQISAGVRREMQIYLEVIVCQRDSREHEALAVTRAKASHIHAALLALNLVPGAPGSWSWNGARLSSTPPTGDPVEVTFVLERNGFLTEEPAASWVRSDRTDRTLASQSFDRFLFSGSRFIEHQGREAYAADLDGTIVGLTAFGDETIAWSAMYNPDATVEAPHWFADPAKVPDFGTPLRVRIRPAR